ncbi:MAG: alpha/beta hydrolase [Chloroflexota bacterium]|nr:alpha/beta hydrolase [Chloroflexota bacterium]MDE2896546.1 alpha/beta hydrolase [Chloroflexota bacterium]
MSSADVPTPTQAVFAARCAADRELRLAVRHWTGGLRFGIGDQWLGFTVVDGSIGEEVPEMGPDIIQVSGPADVWAPILMSPSPPFGQLAVLLEMGNGGLRRSPTEDMLYWQYAPAAERAAELLSEPMADRPLAFESGKTPRHDHPVGRYVHVDLDGYDYRVYYEEAGQGIPLLLQHTAGAHGAQYRHLFEEQAITERFRLIAYDLPYHGKSLPPVGPRWWEQEYQLQGSFLRQVPLALAAALDLDRPAFMGCSVGGLLALDLALRHPDDFRAVISLEGALTIGGNPDALTGFWSPQVSNQSKARMMESLCAPSSPEVYVKEVSQVYSAGWPAAFLGDLYYYLVDFDITERAHEINTERVGVHILTGEYDWSGTVAHGRAAKDAIPGSTHTVMTNVGHFPMQENPTEFIKYLLPVLDLIDEQS